MVRGATDYGKAIKRRLDDLEMTQEQLITEVTKRTGLYFDSSYLYKVMVGKQNSSNIISAINEILGI